MAELRSPVSVTRRNILVGIGATVLTGSASATYAVGIEPLRLSVVRCRIRSIGPWPADLTLSIVALSDLHACDLTLPSRAGSA